MDGHGTVVSSTFTNNEAVNRSGAIWLGGGAIFDVEEDSPNFGQILPDKPTAVIRNSLFTGNRVTSFGGALSTNSRSINRNNGQVTRWEPTVILHKDTFIRNSATMGGAIFNTANLQITNTSIIQNTATQYGGGIYQGGDLAYGISVSLANVTIAQNRAVELGGGLGLFGSRDSFDIVNSTITENAADNSASDGMYVRLPNVTIQNTILANNRSGECDGSKPLRSMGHNLFGRDMARCALVSEGEGDLIRVDPQLGPLTGLDDQVNGNERHELLDGSPALNTGDASLCVDDPDSSLPQLAKDQLDHERIGGCDIGAIEAVCGNGIAHAANGEECDDGNDSNSDECLSTCLSARCGDGIVLAGVEACDDGNAAEGDECAGNCELPACGDENVQAATGEQCDDGNENNDDDCLNTCVTASCGDGFVRTGEEACDDSNQINDDSCSNICVASRCGDFVVQQAEACDDGNQINEDTCSNNCQFVMAQAPNMAPQAPVADNGVSVDDVVAIIESEAIAAETDPLEPADGDGMTAPPPPSPSADGSESDSDKDESTPSSKSSSGGGCNLSVIPSPRK